MNIHLTQDDRVLGEHDTCLITRLAKTSLREKWNPKSARYDESFPKPIKLSARSIGYSAIEIQAWIEKRKQARFEEMPIRKNK